MTPDEEDQNQTQRRSPTANDKRPLSPDPTDSSIKKQRHDSSPSPPSPNVDTTNIASFTSDQTPNNTAQSTTDTLKDTSSKREAEKQDDTPNGSTINHSPKAGEMHYRETFLVVGGDDDIDIEITTTVDEASSTIPQPKDLDEPMENVYATAAANKQVAEGQSESAKQVDTVYTPPAKEPLEGANKAQTAAFSSPGATESAPSQPTPATSKSVPSPTSALESPPSQPTVTASSSSHTKGGPQINIIDRSCAVRLPFSDKFFFTDEAYEAYSYDSFTSTIERMTRNNRPGLAISSDPPKSHTDSSSPSIPSASRAHRPAIAKPSPKRRTDDDTNDPGNNSGDHDNINANTHKKPSPPGNMLDSLLDSISKNDRPVKQPPPPPPPAPPMRHLSDIEIAMQAADLPSQEQI
ncbi:hypothetical protein [Absidia glauca]|uniref:Uncharacterized protein n=1 Tax=Absidia glauca TaxID=4829 RepID=A0A163LUH5_ABSGL|nr:hypothetical protein [Absidia glauca]